MEPTTLTAPQLEKVLNDFKAEMQEFVIKSLANFQAWMQEEPAPWPESPQTEGSPKKELQKANNPIGTGIINSSQMLDLASQQPTEAVLHKVKNILGLFRRDYASKGLTQMTYDCYDMSGKDEINTIYKPTVLYLKQLGYQVTYRVLRDGTFLINISCK